MREGVGPERLGREARLGQGHREASADGGSTRSLFDEADLGPERDVSEVRHRAEIGIVDGGRPDHPAEIELHVVGRRVHEVQDRPVGAVSELSAEKAGLVRDVVEADLEPDRSRGGGARFLGQ